MNKTKLKSANGSFSGNVMNKVGENFKKIQGKQEIGKFNTFMVIVLITQLICSISNLTYRIVTT